MLIILLTTLAIASATITIIADDSGQRRNVYIFKPLTMVFIILIALAKTPGDLSLYKNMIILGLFCSLIGDIFLMLPSDEFIPGLVSFLIAHLFYIIAFTISGSHAFSIFYSLPFFIYGTIMLWILSPYL